MPVHLVAGSRRDKRPHLPLSATRKREALSPPRSRIHKWTRPLLLPPFYSPWNDECCSVSRRRDRSAAETARNRSLQPTLVCCAVFAMGLRKASVLISDPFSGGRKSSGTPKTGGANRKKRGKPARIQRGMRGRFADRLWGRSVRGIHVLENRNVGNSSAIFSRACENAFLNGARRSHILPARGATGVAREGLAACAMGRDTGSATNVRKGKRLCHRRARSSLARQDSRGIERGCVASPAAGSRPACLPPKRYKPGTRKIAAINAASTPNCAKQMDLSPFSPNLFLPRESATPRLNQGSPT